MSESMQSLYSWRMGETRAITIGGQRLTFEITATYRDYARQFGSVTISREVYAKATGDSASSDLSVWLKPSVRPPEAKQAIAALLQAPGDIEIVERSEIRDVSLKIFDRTFAVTYALQAAAIFIALMGISSGFAALAFSRSREFGVLMHLGLTKKEVLKLLTLEGLLATSVAIVQGLVVGLLIAVVLIYVVNRQSFHWGMEIDLPALKLAGFALVTLLCAVVAALFAARAAMSTNAVQLVKEDV
jgi:putative ABC transport system permease protein